MEEINIQVSEDYQRGFNGGFTVGVTVGTMFIVACYYTGRGIGHVISNALDRRDLKKIAKNTSTE